MFHQVQDYFNALFGVNRDIQIILTTEITHN